MKVSIVIPTYNEGRDLESCITSIEKQSEKDFEIIVVDDGSTDNTLQILESFKSKMGNFRYLSQNHKGAGAARNKGAKVAKGKILIFVDADMTFDKKFLANLTAPILKGNARGTFSKDEYVSNWDNVWSRCWNINEGWQAKRRHPADYPDEQPVFRAILKSEFDNVSGFTPGGYDDDWSLSKKLGYMAKVAKEAIFYHKNPSSLVEIYNHAKWVGKRNYKLGRVGAFVALVRASLPFSIILGIIKAIRYKQPEFLVFKIVYDMGIFVGIIKYLTTGNSSK